MDPGSFVFRHSSRTTIVQKEGTDFILFHGHPREFRKKMTQLGARSLHENLKKSQNIFWVVLFPLNFRRLQRKQLQNLHLVFLLNFSLKPAWLWVRLFVAAAWPKDAAHTKMLEEMLSSYIFLNMESEHGDLVDDVPSPGKFGFHSRWWILQPQFDNGPPILQSHLVHTCSPPRL